MPYSIVRWSSATCTSVYIDKYRALSHSRLNDLAAWLRAFPTGIWSTNNGSTAWECPLLARLYHRRGGGSERGCFVVADNTYTPEHRAYAIMLAVVLGAIPLGIGRALRYILAGT